MGHRGPTANRTDVDNTLLRILKIRQVQKPGVTISYEDCLDDRRHPSGG